MTVCETSEYGEHGSSSTRTMSNTFRDGTHTWKEKLCHASCHARVCGHALDGPRLVRQSQRNDAHHRYYSICLPSLDKCHGGTQRGQVSCTQYVLLPSALFFAQVIPILQSAGPRPNLKTPTLPSTSPMTSPATVTHNRMSALKSA